jgi:imidazole glycerol phosphate synthase glutamine amidotransferase subunit
MENRVGIVDYGIAGNIHSIDKALTKAGARTVIIEKSGDFKNVDKIVLPGVGSFKDAMSELEKRGLIGSLKEELISKPTLGICLGMQIFSKIGFEYGKNKGLGIIEAEVKPMVVDAKIPHMGFNSLEIKRNSILLDGIENETFYFMHSYEMVNYTDIVSLTDYSGHKLVSSVQKDNIFGVQFHPEKSRDAGIRLFQNFINI